ncbi:mannitol dehydrogenase family protein [Shewanella sp. UCD-KL21]|uniref:mannitol dehydrogenase family protein n=1 Tax=Shewanella sp. UCD-KL21 TaxID=1917164 RepID=UPI0009711802|nr:mannitol dehydrogenase family protein [Shewanella sp. UCD-KL21]
MMDELLSNHTLNSVKSGITKPSYDYKSSTVGIVHIGIGAFHRAHQAVFTDDLLNQSDRWKITAVSLRSANIRNAMAPQDNLYSVVERCSSQQDKLRIIGAISDVLVAPEEPHKVINVLAQSKTKVVTLTVTEKGYCRDKTGENLDFTNPAIVHDLANLSQPCSLVGFIVAACKVRMLNDDKLTIISCDNLPANGRVTQKVVLQFAQRVDIKVAQWIQENVSFCNSMVDRIVPATTQQDIDFVSQTLGVVDHSTVITEPFKQWVIEDNFINDRPEWDSVGVLFVDDVEAYEDMKLRLLNGIHSTLAYIGFLKGYEYIHQAIEDEYCLQFVKALQTELLATLDDVPGIDLASYADTILVRFANARVPYKTTQVACDGSQKLSQRLVKPLDTLLKNGKQSRLISFVLASWCCFLEGRDSEGNHFNVVDPLAKELTQLATQHADDECKQVHSILRDSGICSAAILENELFITSVEKHLTAIHTLGIEQALKKTLTLEC